MSLVLKMAAFEKHRGLLRDRLETDFGLLDLLQTSRVLSNEEKVRITAAGQTIYDRNDALINYIVKSKEDKLDKICQALRDSVPTQSHLVHFLEKDGDRSLHTDDDIWPLEETQIEALEVNVSSLKSLIFPKPLVNELLAKKVINPMQKEHILSQGTYFSKNEELLQIIRRRSLRDYHKVIEALRSTKIDAAAEILSKGVCLQVTTNLSNESHETELVEKLKQLVKSSNSSPGSSLQCELINLLSQYGVALIEAIPSCSIVLYFLCTSLKGLQFLGDRGRLQGQIQSMYNSLLQESVTVEIKWNQDEFKRCKEYLSKLEERNRSSTNSEQKPVAEPSSCSLMTFAFQSPYPSPSSISRQQSLSPEPPLKKIKTERRPRVKRSASAQCLSQTKDITALTGNRQLVTVKAKVIRLEDRSEASFCAEIEDASGRTKITACKPESARNCREQIKEKKTYFFHDVRDVKSNEKFQRLGHHDCELLFIAGSTIRSTIPSKMTKEDPRVIPLANLDEFRGKLVNVKVIVRRKLKNYELNDVSEGESYWIVCDQSGKEARLQMAKHDDIQCHVNDVLDLKSVRVKLQNHRIDIVSNLGHYSKVGPNTKISRALRNWVNDNKNRIVPIFEDPCTCPLHDDIQSVDKGVMSFRIKAVVKAVNCDEFMACEDCGTGLEQPACPVCKVSEAKTHKTSYLKFRSDAFDDLLMIYVMNEGEQFELGTFHNREVTFTIAPCECEGFDGFRCLEFKLSENLEQRKAGHVLPSPPLLPDVLSTL